MIMKMIMIIIMIEVMIRIMIVIMTMKTMVIWKMITTRIIKMTMIKK